MRKKNPYTFSHFYLQKSSRKHLRLDLELLWLCIVYPTQLDQFNGRIFLNEIFVCSNQCCHLPSNFKKCFVQLGSSNCQQNVSVDCDEKFEENSTWLYRFRPQFLLKSLRAERHLYLPRKLALYFVNNSWLFFCWKLHIKTFTFISFTVCRQESDKNKSFLLTQKYLFYICFSSVSVYNRKVRCTFVKSRIA